MVVRPSKGGAFGHALRLSRELRARGYDAAICGPHGHLADGLDVPIFDVAIPRRPHLIHHPTAVTRIGSVFRRYAPDVIHAHGSQGGVAARLARVAKPDTPLVFSPHNFAFTNYFTSPVERGAYQAIERTLSPLATRFLCVCEAEARVAERVAPAQRIRVVHNGIEPLPAVRPEPGLAELAESGPLLAIVAELQPPKGVTTAIAAMPSVLAVFPDAKLAIAGDGAERAMLEAQIRELALTESVFLLGSIDGVAGLLSAADVCLQPGWSESFPYSVLEAMSLGLPIVATDVGGVGEAIEDDVTGRLIRAQDPTALAGATIDLLVDPERARQLGDAAKARMEERFTFAKMFEGTLDVYSEVGIR